MAGPDPFKHDLFPDVFVARHFGTQRQKSFTKLLDRIGEGSLIAHFDEAMAAEGNEGHLCHEKYWVVKAPNALLGREPADML